MTTVNAPAKVNLSLRVLGKRDDGYHNLDSIIAFADVADQLEFVPYDGCKLSIQGPYAADVPQQNNLVIHAAEALAKALNQPLNVHITLTKNIPIQAGLGGGSADAAATLRGLSAFWKMPLTDPELHAIALNLGSDVPVCLSPQAAHVTGRGEHVERLHMPFHLPVVLVNPRVCVSTPHVFKVLNGHFSTDQTERPVLENLRSMLTWLKAEPNDLTDAAMQIAPQIAVCLQALQNTAPQLARMSGSGATCFGLYETLDDAQKAAKNIREEHKNWWVYAGMVN